MVTLHNIVNPQGIEVPISKLQTRLSTKLGWSNVEIFGRVEKVEADGKKIPQAFDTSTGEYTKKVLTNEQNNNKVFFVPTDKSKLKAGGQMEHVVKVVFMVDVGALYPGGQRSIGEVQAYCLQVVKSEPYFKYANEVDTNIKNILRGFDLPDKTHLLQVHPRHMFSVNATINYFVKKPMYNCKC